ncbi:MAG TPA: PsiF family protein [Steroidobacteraceae bacterium]|nr:PsiF family protein [Steroidobacteraceae bacterium]
MTRYAMILVATLSLCGAAMGAHAETAQQQKMKSCNVEAKAKNLSGADRKQFMKSCLSSGAAQPSSLNSQQEKMKSCNADAKAKALKGTARKQFMSGCLKAH